VRRGDEHWAQSQVWGHIPESNRCIGREEQATSRAGTDFSTAKTTEDWEEVRLKKQLAELEAKVEKVEAASASRSGGRRDTKPALVKRELEQLIGLQDAERIKRDLEIGRGKEQNRRKPERSSG
jgi:hypothetical protein